jgi:hypothetical protein
MIKRFLLILSLVLIISGCVSDPNTYYFNYEELSINVISIELINYENNNPRIINVNESNISNIDFHKLVVLEVLPSQSIDSFIRKISEITFHKSNKSAETPIGRGIKLNYNNGNFVIISCTLTKERGYSFVAEFDDKGKFVKHIAEFADRPKFEKLLDDYFKTKDFYNRKK